MAKYYALHDAGGRIDAFVTVPDDDEETESVYRQQGYLLSAPSNEPINIDMDYVLDNTVLPRPKLSISQSNNTLTGIPAGAILRLGEQDFAINDGEADIEGYHGPVKITCWPYLDAEVEI